MAHRSLRFVLAVALFFGLFAAPWPGRFAPYWPGAYPPLLQILLGASIIALHGLSARRVGNGEAGEAADASYFLGFIMTLLFLVFGLMASRGGIDAAWVARFIADLGVGLSFTVVGLTVRQIAVLQNSAGGPEPARALPGVPDAAQLLLTQADAMRVVTERIEGSISGLSRGAREVAAERMARAVLGFEDRVGESTQKLGKAIEDLTTATTRSAVEIEGASSTLRTALRHDLEALAQEVSRVTSEVAQGRERLFHLLQATSSQAEETQRLVAVTARAQATEWEDQLRATHAHLMGLRAAVEEECRAALGALERSSGALVALGDAVVERVNRLPDPSAGLRSVWSSLGEQEERMVSSISRASGALDALGAQSRNSTEQLQHLDQGASAGARALVESTTALRAALTKDVDAVHRLVDELYAVIEGRIELVGRR